jgi:nitronate monooxygenase
MFDTLLTELIGTEYPILGGTMMDLTTPQFVAAVSEAGALGIIASAMYPDSYEDYRDAIRHVRKATDNPFAVNINLFPMMRKLDNVKYVDIAAEEGVRIIETSGFTPPEDVVSAIKGHGMIWLHKCVGVRYARKAESMGADAVTVVGYENGGATGNLNIATLILVPSTIDAVKVPVIGGGGVVDGRTMLAVLSLGAAGVIVGTRLMLSEECPLHRNVKEALLRATELDTDVIMRSVGFAHRIWMNTPARKIAEIEESKGDLEDILPLASGWASKKMYEMGDTDAGTVSCSQGVGLIHDIKPVREVIADMVSEAARIHEAFAL